MNYSNYFLKNKTFFLGILISFLGSYILFPSYFNLNILPLSVSKELWVSLDPSWTIALNYLKINGATWGKDIAFTYGPLAPLFTRLSWGENKFTFLIFDLFIFINYFYLFLFTFLKSKTKIISLVLILSICLLTPFWSGVANALILMAFLVFWISISIEKFKWVYYFFQIIIILILFYGKFNTALIALPLFYVGLFYNLIVFKENKTSLLLLAFLPLLIIIILSFPFNVDLFFYIKSGFEIIKGYNDVMYLNNQIGYSLLFATLLILALSAIMFLNIFTVNKFKLLKFLVIIFLFSASFFVLYKQSFVRADTSHIIDFFIFIPLFILCNTNLYFKIKNPFLKSILVLLIIFSFSFLFLNFKKKIDLKIKVDKSEYIKAFDNFNNSSGLLLFKNNIPLPDNIIKKIGRQSVDIFPWNIQLLLENELNYLSRPVFQSYSSYTPYLEKLNFDHYNSINAPEFVLFDYLSIDDRYPFYDETKVNLALLKNYELADSFNYNDRNILLLQKKKDFKEINFIKSKEYAMYIDSPVIMKEGVYYEIFLYHSIKGNLVSLLKNAPEISIKIITNDGSINNYKSSKLLLESGIYSPFLIKNTSDFKNLIQQENSNNKIKGLFIKPLDRTSFRDKIKIIEYKID